MSNRPSNWETIRNRVLQRDNNECQNCGVKGGSRRRADLEVHHIVPLESGGSNQESNLKALCSECHDAVHYDKTAPTGKSSYTNLIKSSSLGPSTNSGSNTQLSFLKVMVAPFVLMVYFLGIMATILSIVLTIQAYILAILGYFLLVPIWVFGKGVKKFGEGAVNVAIGYEFPSYEEKTIYVGYMRPLVFFFGLFLASIYLNSTVLMPSGLVLSWLGVSIFTYFDARFLQARDANFQPTRVWAGISLLTLGVFGCLYVIRRVLYTKIKSNMPSPSSILSI